jgi:simple sugar transport system ATP-binding protein
MVGVTDPDHETPTVSAGGVVLSIEGLSIDEPRRQHRLHEVGLELREGELMALAGVAGNGQTELAEAITGHITSYDGTIRIAGRDIRGLGPRAVNRLGVAYVPENRREVGLVGGQSVAINLALRRYDRPPFSHSGWLDRPAIRRAALELMQRYGIQPTIFPGASIRVLRNKLSKLCLVTEIGARRCCGSPVT